MNIKYKNKRNRLVAVLVALAIFVGFCPLNTANVTASSAVTVASVEHSTYVFTDDVGGLTVTYYNDIYSRGFCWFTAESNPATELYVAAGDLGENTAFTESHKVPEANCSSVLATDGGSYYSHKAHITGLTPGKTYSYKVGGNGHYRYGTFTVESSGISKIDIITLTDAQTKNLSLLHVWENTAAQSIGVMQNPDFVLYGGDQYDVGGRVNNSSVLAYGAALDTVTGRIGSIPYMAAAGNHDYQVTVNRADINYADSNDPGYYSFDYGFAHFVVLNTKGMGGMPDFTAQKTWLENDLEAANQNDKTKWTIVMIHNGPHSTGDHSADKYSKNVSDYFAETFSRYHVDLVLQGHDHTYSKTLPYRWDTAGRTTSYGDGTIVNYDVLTA
ncbi:MAG: metallophosphoesterase family protein, partial [Clostridia bacterium]|nr:metallophosphoesterase family protein [Clostridia bacterium]